MSETGQPRSDALDAMLRLGAGFGDADRQRVLDALSALQPHLSGWDPDDVDLEISVKHRGSKEQQVTLRADVPGYPPLVAKASNADLTPALAEVKRELIAQVEAAKGKREPKENRQLRKRTT
jgi:ribosome-associated translation inhibitor RaiA